MDLVVEPGPLDPFRFHRSLSPTPPGDPVQVDLSQARFVEVHGLVGALCLAWRAARKGQGIMLTMPRRSSVASYVTRMRLPVLMDRLGAQVVGEVPSIGEWDQSGWLIELSPFKTDDDAERIAQMVFRTIEQADVQVQDALHASVGELASNTWEHAKAPDGGVMAAQALPNKRDLLVSVGDPGVGLRASLGRRHNVTDDAEGIELALSSMVSGLDDSTRGRGLPETAEWITALQGLLYVHSGEALRIVGRAGHNQDLVGGHFPGTLISAKIPSRPR